MLRQPKLYALFGSVLNVSHTGNLPVFGEDTMANPPTQKERQFVEPEAITWEINATTLRMWQENGVVLMKAHRVKEVESFGRPAHASLCGVPGHLASACELAPEGWPKCKKCAGKLGTGIPAVYWR